jgi:hypothetical protein
MLDQLKAEHPFLFLLVVTSAIVAIATPAYALAVLLQWWNKRKKK